MEHRWIIEPYTPEKSGEWDEFVKASKNGTFLLTRPYMDYHADRFPDNSLIIRYDDGRIAALLPASLQGDTLVSHPGLTYGGFVMPRRNRAQFPMEWIGAIRSYLRGLGVRALHYKCIPYVYHREPADEDRYALFRADAQSVVCNLASVVPLNQPFTARLGHRAARRIQRYGLEVERAHEVAEIWHIIEDDRRIRHNTRPVHTLEEMRLLAGRFPDNITIYKTLQQGRIVAGAVVYLFPESGVIHLQYAAANAEGFDIHAVDAIYHVLAEELRGRYKWFDFGTSNEDGGRYLNTGMTAHKEEFGGCSVVYPQYKLDI